MKSDLILFVLLFGDHCPNHLVAIKLLDLLLLESAKYFEKCIFRNLSKLCLNDYSMHNLRLNQNINHRKL